MRVAIAAPSAVPFRLGGAERAWNGLIRELMQNTPHQADLIKLPAPEESLLDVVRSYESFARLDLAGFDLLVTTKYPAWLAYHEDHVVYLFHPLRALYDLYPGHAPARLETRDGPERSLRLLLHRSPERPLLDEMFGRFWQLVDEVGPGHPVLTFPGPLARELVHFLDRVALNPRYVRRHLALSRTVASRPDYFPPGASIEVLYLPPNLEGFSSRRFDYLFAPTRLEANKRPDLLVDAMRHVNAPVQLRIAGTGPALDHLRAIARDDPRVRLLGSISDRQVIDSYADALAVPVVPRDEDYGLITLEAMRSGKPVITSFDSGGPTELVRHGETGLVADPTPQAIAAAIDRLAADPDLARRLGEAGRVRAEPITWHRTVTTLLQPYREAGVGERRPGRSKVAIASVGCIRLARSAAELRTAHLARALVSEFDVEVVGLGRHGDRPSRRVLAEGLVETVVPCSDMHAEADQRAAAEAGLPVRELLAAQAERYTPEFVMALGRACRSADALILSGPYLQPAAAALRRQINRIYYAHRVEERAWATLLRPDSELAELALSLEREAVAEALSVLAATPEDTEAVGAREAALLGLDPREVPTAEPSVRAAARDRWLESALAGLPVRPDVDRVALFLGDDSAGDIAAARVLTAIAEALPRVLHVIVGCDHDDVSTTPPPNVVLTGLLSETAKRALLGAVDLAVAPLTVMEARPLLAECLAAGLPLVTTLPAAHGLPVIDGRHALVRDVADFPEAVQALLDEPGLGERLAADGRALVEQYYDADSAGDSARTALSREGSAATG
jgi:glycosyltransferase involved in cell wall biosynthesis